MQEINIYTTLCYNNSFPQILGILNNNKELFGQVIIKKIDLDDIVEKGIKALSTDKIQVKILVLSEM